MLPTALRISSPPSTGVLVSGGGKLLGWSFRETSTTAPARFQLLDGSSGVGVGLLETITLSADQSTRDWESIRPKPYYEGLVRNVIAGVFEGVVWVAPYDPNAVPDVPIVISVPLPVYFQGP